MVSGWFPLGLCGRGRALDHRLAAAQGRGGFQPILGAAEGAIALSQAPDWPQRLLPVYRERRDRTLQALARLGWQVPTPSMALYLWLPLPGWARERGWRDEQLTAALLEQTGLALTPGSGFGAGGQDWMRMALVRPIEELEAAVARLEPFWQQQC